MIAGPLAAALSPIDLHCHSQRSDGCLTPRALVARAASRGLRVLALTDHDTLEGLDEAHAAAKAHGVVLVPGVEISVSWCGRTVHVVGLNVDPGSAVLQSGLHGIREGRVRRAESIAQRLAGVGIREALPGAMRHAANPSCIGRTHFARHLVTAGVVGDMKAAFRRFLAEGKPAYVRHRWASLQDAVRWIGAAGGESVLAHPCRYGLRAARLRTLFDEFRLLGGTAVEIATAGQADEATQLVRLTAASGLAASSGSDFHGEDSWLDLGELPELPRGSDPIWRRWPLTGSADLDASEKNSVQ